MFLTDVLHNVLTLVLVTHLRNNFEVRIALGPGPLSADLPGPLLGGGVTPLLQPGVAHCLDLLPVLHLLDWLTNCLQNFLTEFSDPRLVAGGLAALLDIFGELWLSPHSPVDWVGVIVL